jgi:hypothetical protein
LNFYIWICIKIIHILLIIIILSGCIPKGIKDFNESANQKFGDQHFKTAISLIELHKIREGEYPAALDSLQYLGDWDKIIFSSVKYTKVENGYELDLIRG